MGIRGGITGRELLEMTHFDDNNKRVIALSNRLKELLFVAKEISPPSSPISLSSNFSFTSSFAFEIFQFNHQTNQKKIIGQIHFENLNNNNENFIEKLLGRKKYRVHIVDNEKNHLIIGIPSYSHFSSMNDILWCYPSSLKSSSSSTKSKTDSPSPSYFSSLFSSILSKFKSKETIENERKEKIFEKMNKSNNLMEKEEEMIISSPKSIYWSSDYTKVKMENEEDFKKMDSFTRCLPYEDQYLKTFESLIPFKKLYELETSTNNVHISPSFYFFSIYFFANCLKK